MDALLGLTGGMGILIIVVLVLLALYLVRRVV